MSLFLEDPLRRNAKRIDRIELCVAIGIPGKLR
jgi:hypothetical protein